MFCAALPSFLLRRKPPDVVFQERLLPARLCYYDTNVINDYFLDLDQASENGVQASSAKRARKRSGSSTSSATLNPYASAAGRRACRGRLSVVQLSARAR